MNRSDHELPGLDLTLSGWGRTAAARTRLSRPDRLIDVRRGVEGARSVVARGEGRSYGDAAVNGMGCTMEMSRLNRLLAFDPETGQVDAEGGVRIADLVDVFTPRGWFPPVTPGTRFVTVGGCVASNVHGKNHHWDGSFARHVLDLDLVTAEGATVRCSRSERPDLFWATVGGMGLTGVIIRVRIQLLRIEGETVAAEFRRIRDLDTMFEQMEAADDRFRYSVAWVDALATGRGLGRGVLQCGEHGGGGKGPQGRYCPPGRGYRLPGVLSLGLRRGTMRLFNEVYYRRTPWFVRRTMSITSFFYPLDRVRAWNRLYGRRGLHQYQFVLPMAHAREGIRSALALVSRQGPGSFLAVLKRFGSGEPEAPLSFPIEGYTLALDLPATKEALAVMDRMDEIVLEHGGRVYLAKDARLRKDTFRAMYPQVDRWLECKAQVDPDGRIASDLARRLGLVSS